MAEKFIIANEIEVMFKEKRAKITQRNGVRRTSRFLLFKMAAMNIGASVEAVCFEASVCFLGWAVTLTYSGDVSVV